MTTPPRPSHEEYERALRRLHRRRRDAGDDHPMALSEDPREVLAYLRQRGRNGLIQDGTGDDVTDALTLRLWLWWEGETTELWLLEAAEHLDRNRRAIGRVLGLTSGQGLIDRINRIRSRLGRTHTRTRPVAASEHDVRIRALAADLVAGRDQMPDEIADDWKLGIVQDALDRWPAGRPAPSEGTVNTLRFLLGDLDPAVPPGTPLRAVVDAGTRLLGTRNDDITFDISDEAA